MIVDEPGDFGEQVLLWGENLSYFFSPAFFIALLPSILIWSVSYGFAMGLLNLQIEEAELYMDNLSMLDKNQVDQRQRLGEWILVIGVGVVIMAFFARVNLVQLFGETPATRGPVYNVVAYFVLGFVLLSQAQLSSLRRTWLWDRIPAGEGLFTRWVGWSLLFFILLALLALLLPTHYTVGLLDTLRIVFTFITSLFSLLLLAIAYPFAALINLLLGKPAPQDQPVPPVKMPDFGPTVNTGQPLPWLEVLRSLVFWLILVAIIVYFFRSYFLQNKQLMGVFRKLKFIQWLRQFWSGLWHLALGVNAQVGQALKAGRERLFPQHRPSLASRLRRSINFRGLSPRQRVIFFYLRMVERGSEHGIPRSPAQTPYQYSQQLRETLPEVEPELDHMTQAFLDARYSPHDVGLDQAAAVQSWWKRIIQALHSARKPKSE